MLCRTCAVVSYPTAILLRLMKSSILLLDPSDRTIPPGFPRLPQHHRCSSKKKGIKSKKKHQAPWSRPAKNKMCWAAAIGKGRCCKNQTVRCTSISKPSQKVKSKQNRNNDDEMDFRDPHSSSRVPLGRCREKMQCRYNRASQRVSKRKWAGCTCMWFEMAPSARVVQR